MSTLEETRAFAAYLEDFEGELLQAYEDHLAPFIEAHGAELASGTADQLTMVMRDLGDLTCAIRDLRHNDFRLLLRSRRQATGAAEAG
jgi:hypothetical protein